MRDPENSLQPQAAEIVKRDDVRVGVDWGVGVGYGFREKAVC